MMVRRRRLRFAVWLFLTFALAVPVTCAAQPSGLVPRIGYLQVYPSAKDSRFEAFRQQLRELGYVEGRTVLIDYLSAEGQYDKLPALAREVTRRQVNVIVADGGSATTLAAMKATRTIPIVFCCVTNPVEQGMVASLARPRGNVTGVTNQNSEFAPKLLELLKEVFPSAKRIAVLSNSNNPSLPIVLDELRATASALRLEVVVANVRSPAEFDGALNELSKARPVAVLVIQDPMLTSGAAQLAALAAKHGLTVSGGNNIVAEQGGLISYGPNLLDLVRRAAIMVDKILKGAKAADLPVEQPTKFDLVINTGTARALGLKIPQSLIVRADRVID